MTDLDLQGKSTIGGVASVERHSRRPAGSRLARTVGRRLLLSVPLIVTVSVLTFVLVSLIPGDPAQEILGANATPAAVEQLRHELGLDRTWVAQYQDWLTAALGGDLGTSLFTHEPVAQAITTRLPVTLVLIVATLLVQLVLGVGLGVASAIRGGFVGRSLDALALFGLGVPSFWLGTILISLFAVTLGWLPATGYVAFSQSPVDWLRSIVLPVTALSVLGIATLAKQTRDAMLDVLASDYIQVARANGIPGRSLYLKHALKNSSMRIVTVIGLNAIGLIGGTVVVETVFALPGLGSLAVTACLQGDIPVIQGVALVATVIVVGINLLVDIAYTVLNPRVEIA